MKNCISLLLRACLPMFLFLSGCLEEHVHTIISADGSSERVISMKLGSHLLSDKAFPVPSDSTWSVEWKDITEKDAKYEYVARKKFRSPDELHNEYSFLPDTNVVGLRVTVNKKFEWFFSYIEYDEVYFFRNPFGNIPVSNYLTKEEIARFVGGEKSDSLKDKVKRWTSRDIFEEIYRPLVAEAKRRNDRTFPASLLEEKKEEVFELVMNVDSENTARKQADSGKFVTTKENVDSAQAFLKLLAKTLHTEAVVSLRSTAQRAWNSMESKLERIKHPDGWVSSVQMPGMILETNSNSVEGNSVTWKFDPEQIQAGDYAMHAVSRVTNVWAFVVTGIAALLAIILGFRIALRSR